MKLYVLDGGTLWTEMGFLSHFGTESGTGKEYQPGAYKTSSCQYYIDHPKAKILIDAGFNLANFPTEGFPLRSGPEGVAATQRSDQNTIDQLAKIGVTPEEIDFVVISHLMSDHAGYLPRFAGTKAKIIVQEAEREYADRLGVPPNPDYEPAVEQFHSWMYFRNQFEVPGLDFMEIKGDLDLVGRDVEILSLPGHTPGFQNVMVRLSRTGPVFLSACETRAMYYGIPINGYAPGIPHSFTWSASGELHSFKKVRKLVEDEEGQIFFGHDYEQFSTLKRAPECYE